MNLIKKRKTAICVVNFLKLRKILWFKWNNKSVRWRVTVWKWNVVLAITKAADLSSVFKNSVCHRQLKKRESLCLLKKLHRLLGKYWYLISYSISLLFLFSRFEDKTVLCYILSKGLHQNHIRSFYIQYSRWYASLIAVWQTNFSFTSFWWLYVFAYSWKYW